jgi:hypothetical protein
MRMRPQVRAHFLLASGARLLFDPEFPAGYEEHGQFSVDSDGLLLLELKEKYRGQDAMFEDYLARPVGPLNKEGRLPGRYADPKAAWVIFDDKARHCLYLKDFIVLPGLFVRHEHPLRGGQEDRRVGDLKHPIEFWPGDKVCLPHKKEIEFDNRLERPVRGVFFNKDDTLRYFVLGVGEECWKIWEASVEEIELVSRGNVWALYNAPEKLSFKSDKEEMEFWRQDEILQRTPSSRRVLMPSYPSVNEALDAGWDMVDCYYKTFDHEAFFSGRRLHDCFAQHRDRVRALTQRFHAAQAVEVMG